MVLRTGIYPGTFDPVTYGHVDLIQRSAKLVDHLVVAVANNLSKKPLFTADERCVFLRDALEGLQGIALGGTPLKISVVAFDGLLVDFAHKVEANLVIRGIRALSDFDYEFQMAGMNRKLSPHIETIFLMASETHHFVSSRFVKEVARFGGNVADFVTPTVLKALQDRASHIEGTEGIEQMTLQDNQNI